MLRDGHEEATDGVALQIERLAGSIEDAHVVVTLQTADPYALFRLLHLHLMNLLVVMHDGQQRHVVNLGRQQVDNILIILP